MSTSLGLNILHLSKETSRCWGEVPGSPSNWISPLDVPTSTLNVLNTRSASFAFQLVFFGLTLPSVPPLPHPRALPRPAWISQLLLRLTSTCGCHLRGSHEGARWFLRQWSCLFCWVSFYLPGHCGSQVRVKNTSREQCWQNAHQHQH